MPPMALDMHVRNWPSKPAPIMLGHGKGSRSSNSCTWRLRIVAPLRRDNACLLWSLINYEHPYPDRKRKDALGTYAGRNKAQVLDFCFAAVMRAE